jgi:integrase
MPFFVSAAGSALPSRTVHSVFVGLRTRLGWHSRGEHPHPRIHDLRHTFAVRRVLAWQKCGAIEHGLLMLCTYLGHAKVSDTYWYLTAVPELMAIVGDSFERFALGVMEVKDA